MSVRRLYFGVLLCTGLAAMLLIAPSMHHRLEFRQRDKEYLVVTANRLTIAGLSCLAVAMTGAILLVTHVLFGTAATIVTSSVLPSNTAEIVVDPGATDVASPSCPAELSMVAAAGVDEPQVTCVVSQDEKLRAAISSASRIAAS